MQRRVAPRVFEAYAVCVRQQLRTLATPAREPDVRKLRNVGIFAHVDHGKTTLAERMLYYSGYTRTLGDVDDGNTVMDFMPEEQRRGITIKAAAITFKWKDTTVNLIDTPGHVDFTVEVERSARVLDGAVVVVDAVSGVQAQTETVWRQSNNVPRLVFVNKMDRVGADFARAVSTIKARLNAVPLIVQQPAIINEEFAGVIDVVSGAISTFEGKQGAQVVTTPATGQQANDAAQARATLIEQLADYDDTLMNLALSDPKSISDGDLRAAVRRVALSLKAVPVLCGSAFKNKGVQFVLDGIADYLPSPLDITTAATLLKGGTHTTRTTDANGPLTAFGFKVIHDGQRGVYVYCRVFSGTLRPGLVFNANLGAKERVTKLYHVSADNMTETESITAGNIGAVLGLKVTRTGDTLVGPQDQPVVLSGLNIPPPVFFCAVEPETASDMAHLEESLKHLAREDPSVHVRTDSDTGQLLVSGMGELHLEIVQNRLTTHYKAKARMGSVQISYRETTDGESRISHTYNRTDQLSATLQVHLTRGSTSSNQCDVVVPPPPEQTGRKKTAAPPPAAVPADAIQAVQQGVLAALERGPACGFPMIEAHVSVAGIEAYATTPPDVLQACAMQATVRALRGAGTRIVEPLMATEVTVDERHLGAVIGELTQRRANINDIGEAAGKRVVKALVPLRELIGYATTLRSLTQGAGTFTNEFASYGPVPQSREAEMKRGIM